MSRYRNVFVGSDIVVKWTDGSSIMAEVVRIAGNPGDTWRMAEVRPLGSGLISHKERAWVPLHCDEVSK